MLILKASYKVPKIHLFLCLLSCYIVSCNNKSKTQKPHKIAHKTVIKEIQKEAVDSFAIVYEQCLQDAGLIDLKTIDSSIALKLKYATTDNFMHINLYHSFAKCYLHPETASKLKVAQNKVQMNNQKLRLVIFDATRPSIVQQMMWDSTKMNIIEKRKFLSNPKNFSIHNFGLAVDCSLIDEQGTLIDMGTEYDYAGEKAYPCKEQEMLLQGELTEEQIAHRRLLRNAMLDAGFSSNPYEWWHFNVCSRAKAKKAYNRIVDFRTFVKPEQNVIISSNNDSM